MKISRILNSYVLGLILTMTLGIASATNTFAFPKGDGALHLVNASPHSLHFSIEFEDKSKIYLGQAQPNASFLQENGMLLDGVILRNPSNLYVIHAKNDAGNEIFTTFLYRDEFLETKGVITIPGTNGRFVEELKKQMPKAQLLPTPITK